jgi:hypothetical protein
LSIEPPQFGIEMICCRPATGGADARYVPCHMCFAHMSVLLRDDDDAEPKTGFVITCGAAGFEIPRTSAKRRARVISKRCPTPHDIRQHAYSKIAGSGLTVAAADSSADLPDLLSLAIFCVQPACDMSGCGQTRGAALSLAFFDHRSGPEAPKYALKRDRQ